MTETIYVVEQVFSREPTSEPPEVFRTFDEAETYALVEAKECEWGDPVHATYSHPKDSVVLQVTGGSLYSWTVYKRELPESDG